MKLRVFGLALLGALVALPALAVAQTRAVTGTVTKAGSGQPVTEALVTVVGGRGVSRTNAAGKFTINIPEAGATLSVRAIGYKSKDVIVKAGESNLGIALVEDAFKLEEVVVTGQATTISRKEATTAIATVNNEEITRAPAQSLEQALQGKVLGTSINLNSGAPGGGGQIQIRGVTSILGNGQPLFVVDGVIISNDGFSSGANAVTQAGGNSTAAGIGSTQDQVVNRLADLNPNEIESIEILKSASATAIYGSRATNGVVVIRTKRGTPGKARFNITQRFGVANPLVSSLGGRVFTNTNEVYNLPYGNGSNAAAVAYLNSTFGGSAAGAGAPISAAQNFNFEELYYSNRKPSYETTVNYSGGDENTSYFVGATHRQEVGLSTNTGARLQSLRINVDQTFSSRFTLKAGLNVTRNVLDRGLGNNDNTCTSPVYCFGYTPGVIDLRSTDAQGNFIQNPFNGGGSSVSNPFQTAQFLKLTEDVFRQAGSLNAAYTIINDNKNKVDVRASGGFDRFNQQGTLNSPSFLQYEGYDGFLGRTAYTSVNGFNYNLQANLSWTYTGKPQDWSVTTTAGASFEEQNVNLVRTRARGILPGVVTTSQGTADQIQNITQFRDQAFFANMQILALGEKLSILGGFRADQSSANGNIAKFNFFPRVSAAYRIEKLGPIEFVKIRGGYGQTGNRPRYGDRNILLNAGSNIGGAPSLVAPGTLGNALITPETLNELEVGTDIQLSERVSFEATYYNRTIKDQLLQPPAPVSSGIGSFVVNGGQLSNKGWELGLTLVPISTGDFSWTARTTWQKNTQRVDSLPANQPTFNAPGSFGAAYGRNRIAPGVETTAIWGNVPVNVQGTGSSAVITILPAGVYANPALSTLPVTGVRDTIAGNANPDFQMYFNNSFQFKRFTLAFTVDWRKGGDVACMTCNLFDEGGTSRDFTLPAGTIVPSGGLKGVAVPAINSTETGTPTTLGQFRYDAWNGGSDVRVYLQDGGFVRMRDIQLSYDTPAGFAKAFGASSVRFNVQARNVFMITKYWGYDPEFNNFGNTNLNRFIDLAPFPSARSFYVSVDVGF